MFLRELDAGFDSIRGAGPAARDLLARLGIKNVKDLLCHYPRDWEDRSAIIPFSEWSKGRVCTEAKILAHEWFGRGYRKTLKILVEDDTARASLICFNRSFLAKQFPVGMDVQIYGKFDLNSRYGEIQSSSFEIGSPEKSGVILPVYNLTEGLTQTMLRNFTSQAINQFTVSIEDELPENIVKRDKLMPKAEAIRAIHFPVYMQEKDEARKTLVYEELFYFGMIAARRVTDRKKINAISLNEKQSGVPNEKGSLSPMQKRLIERLPFKLTQGQKDALAEINNSMDGPYPMARLLQGDVGSGKTLVSFLACIKAVETGKGQACIMAPTELLARQHAENAAKLLEPLGLRIAFLTGNVKSKDRSQLLKALAAGEIDLVVGTHALFSRDTVYRNLNLVVIDEQHRFGVTQRQAAMDKGEAPHLLMMSATPIPRTLALTVFGDLDVSIISDMPPGRKPIKTHLCKSSNADKVYDFVRKELEAGRQAYFVYPLIEASETRDLKDAESMAKQLSKQVFINYPVALIHSRLDEEEKRRIMEAFRKDEIKVLAATSVVEVGVDVPNASCMVVEHAERFGLAALHQLRGRVGRGDAQSYCFLIYADQDVPEEFAGMSAELLNEEERSREGRRLMVMLENNDGFVIAEKDLLFRGPGQITGLQQSGYLALGLADPLKDTDELEKARADAFAIIKADPELKEPQNRRIAEVLERAAPFGEVSL